MAAAPVSSAMEAAARDSRRGGSTKSRGAKAQAVFARSCIENTCPAGMPQGQSTGPAVSVAIAAEDIAAISGGSLYLSWASAHAMGTSPCGPKDDRVRSEDEAIDFLKGRSWYWRRDNAHGVLDRACCLKEDMAGREAAEIASSKGPRGGAPGREATDQAVFPNRCCRKSEIRLRAAAAIESRRG